MTYRCAVRLTAGAIFCLLALFASEIALAAEPKRVMLLHSFGREFKPWNVYANSIRSELDLQSPWPLDVIEHSLITARFSNNDSQITFVEYLRDLYGKHQLDLIICLGAPAADFIQRYRQELFPSTPTLFTSVEQRRIQRSSLTENDAVVALAQNFPAIVENILHVLPDTRTMVVLIGSSPVERLWLEVLRKEFAQFADRLSFIWSNDRSFADILKHAAALPPHSAIYWHQMNVDAAGVVHEGGKALTTLYGVANAPIFSFTDAFFGDGVVGGPMNSVGEASRTTVAVALRILGGEKAGNINIPPIGFATPRFDWRQMQRWGIREASLPPGSQIYFRDPGLWDQYRLPILVIIAAILLQAGLISWLIHEHRRRSLAEVRSRNALAELAHFNRLETAGQLSASIAHEINQPITGMVLKASAALRWLSTEKPDVEKVRGILTDIVNAGQRAGDIITGVRAMFKKGTNAKTAINLNNLINTVLALLHLDLQKEGVRTETQLDQELPAIAGDAVQLQQVILNLIVNAADAMRVVEPRVLRIQSNRTVSGSVRVSIEDSGTGISEPNRDRIFDPLFTTKVGGMGMGLSICRSIIENHGGKIWASPGVNGGSIFQFELPTKSNS